MIFTIDDLELTGSRDLSSYLDGGFAPRIERRLNQGSSLVLRLAAKASALPPVAPPARVWLRRNDGTLLFSGYLQGDPVWIYVGRATEGDVYALELTAAGEEMLLDAVALPTLLPPNGESAGSLLQALTEAAQPGVFDTSGVAALGSIGAVEYEPGIVWSQAAARIAGAARAAWTLGDGKLTLAALGSTSFTLAASDASFAPDCLTLKKGPPEINDLTLSAGPAPGMYVKDYFSGDGTTLSFSLSQTPYLNKGRMLLNEEFSGSLAPQLWAASDAAAIFAVSGGALVCSGGGSASGNEWVTLKEELELAAPLTLEVETTSLGGSGVLSGLYDGSAAGTCRAGYSLSGGVLQPIIDGAAVGNALTLVSGHKQVLRIHLTGLEPYRQPQICLSGAASYQGLQPSALLRVVFAVQDLDPATPSTQTAVATILYDGQLGTLPATAVYAAVNGAQMQGSILAVRIGRPSTVEVRTTPSGGTTSTRLQGSLYEGAEYTTGSGKTLVFHASYAPASAMLVAARYRAAAKAVCRITDPAAMAALARTGMAGVRPALRHLLWPVARTFDDCRSAALAALDGMVSSGWSGSYELWSDFLPAGTTDIHPGDNLHLNVPELATALDLTLRRVTLEVTDTRAERTLYHLEFANDAAAPVALELQPETASAALEIDAATRSASTSAIASVSGAEVTAVASGTVTVDMGVDPPSGGGFEVRSLGDWGWGLAANRNLLGRYYARSFVLPYNAKGQEYYLRMFDASAPPVYSPVTTLLHVSVSG